MWVQGKMVLKCDLFKIIPLHIQELNYGNLSICELKDHVGEVALNLNWSKAWTRKKNSSHKLSQLLIRKCLNQINVSLCLVASPQRGKIKHHWGRAHSQSRYHFFATKTQGLCVCYLPNTKFKWNKFK
jgi:hypothetical protein